ncbi:17945_t:CDS:1, partial [Racocetra fulgida]
EKDYKIKIKDAFETNTLGLENTDNIDDNEETQYFDNQVLTSAQIKKFKKIFLQSTIKENNEEQEANEKIITLLD